MFGFAAAVWWVFERLRLVVMCGSGEEIVYCVDECFGCLGDSLVGEMMFFIVHFKNDRSLQ